MIRDLKQKVKIQAPLWKRRLKQFSLICLAVFLVYSFLGGNFGYIRIKKLIHKQRELKAEQRDLIIQLSELSRLKEQIQSDPRFLEYFARQRYHLVYPDEKVFIFRPEPPASRYGNQ